MFQSQITQIEHRRLNNASIFARQDDLAEDFIHLVPEDAEFEVRQFGPNTSLGESTRKIWPAPLQSCQKRRDWVTTTGIAAQNFRDPEPVAKVPPVLPG